MKRILVLTFGTFKVGAQEVNEYLKEKGQNIEIVFKNFTPAYFNSGFDAALDELKNGDYDLYLMSTQISNMWGDRLKKQGARFKRKVIELECNSLYSDKTRKDELLQLLDTHIVTNGAAPNRGLNCRECFYYSQNK